jgi:hypothetical protein
MCMGCMSNADFLVTGGVLGAASVRVGLRRLLPVPPAFARKVTDEEATAFIASLAPPSRADTPVPLPVPAAG